MKTLLDSQTSVSARQFTVFRIIFGTYLAWHYTALVTWGAELFSAAGILGAPGANPFHGRWWNPLFHPAAAPLATILPALAGILSLLLACGIGRRPVAVALAIIHSMLFTACPLIANPGLPYVGLLLWLCAIIPPGETWSASTREWFMPGIAFFAANFLLAAGYTFSGASKLTSPGWLDGTALNTVLQSALARSNGIPGLLIALPDEILSLMTWGTLAFEVAYLPLWLFPRFRAPLWIAAVAFHTGILLTLDFADLTLGMLMIHLLVMPASKQRLTFAPAIRSSSSTQAPPNPAMKTASLAALLFIVASASSLIAEVRIWKDASGLHEVKAELIGVAAGVVSLKTADGRTVKLQFAQLSKEDQAFLKAGVAGSSGGAASGASWPQWRGPNRDDSNAETGLLKEWPADGPKRLWVNEDAGLGYSGFSIVDGVLYTLGLTGEDEKLIAIDAATGKKLWDTNVGGRLRNNWGDGPRSTPTVAGGLVFALGGNGDLVCADAKTGKKKWDKSLTKDLGGVIQNWGYTESPLVEGELVIVTPGGSKGTIAALSVKNGAVKWQTKDYTENAQYASAIAIEHEGKRQIVQLVMNSFVGVSAEDGKQLWKAEFPGRTAVIPTPIHKDGFIYVAAGYGVGCKMIKLGGGTPETVYENKTMANHHGGVILVGDNLYGYSDGGGWVCQDFKTGAEKWSERAKLRKGCVAYADGMLYCVGEDGGDVVLIEASPEGWKEHGRFKLEKQSSQRAAQGKIWTHPVICGGRLYLRDQEFISCYDVKKS